jgi:hypothetical protein
VEVLCSCDRLERNVRDLFSRWAEGDVEIVNFASNFVVDQSVNEDVGVSITLVGRRVSLSEIMSMVNHSPEKKTICLGQSTMAAKLLYTFLDIFLHESSEAS